MNYFDKPTRRRVRRKQRVAAILVWFALVLPLLLGMVGLVIDAGLLMSSHRHLQNSVDAAAMAGAHELMGGRSVPEASLRASVFVTGHHDLADAKVDVFSPPESGPYAGREGYVEVVAEHETKTIFIQLLNGVHKTRRAKARAVAGAEMSDIIDGIIALDYRTGIPGLAVTGNAQLRSSGRIIVNSENGGVDQNGDTVDSGQPGFGAFVSPFALVEAEEVYLVGGVNRVDRFQSIDGGGSSPLKTGQLPIADPLAHLPAPSVSNGVVDIRRGSPVVTAAEIQLNNGTDSSDSRNYIETNEATGEQTLVLHPGVYSSIDITGGKVRFLPGIYAMAASREKTYSVKILDGDIDAQGVMFYNTRDNYDPISGLPDADDGGSRDRDGEDTGQIRINAALGFSAIDTLQHNYGNAAPLISQFNGMLIYQRRRNIANVQIQGFTQDKTLSGVIYAKQANLRMPAGGVLNTQIVVGRISVPGHGDLLVKHDSNDLAQSLDVYLVE